MKKEFIKTTFILSVILTTISFCQIQTSHPISAPITNESPGKMGVIAVKSVMRIICTDSNMGGTGFLHKSGWIITAAHVVANCKKNDLIIITSDGKQLKIDSLIFDNYLDLAVLRPTSKLNIRTLELSSKTTIKRGALVTTWGFPSGYNSFKPLLTVGYLAGVDQMMTSAGLSPARWVVNAAFNGGNSGGPVLDVELGNVIGVVSSKLAPIPPYIESALEALSHRTSGIGITKILPDGTEKIVTESQVIADVLIYLRSQTQLVLGHAVTSKDLIDFLIRNQIAN